MAALEYRTLTRESPRIIVITIQNQVDLLKFWDTRDRNSLNNFLFHSGYYCTGGAGVPTQYETKKGHYSLEGAYKQTPCPRGQFQQADKSSSCDSCQIGRYCNTTGGEESIICPPGHYCPEGSEYPTPCPKGTFNVDEGR